MNWLVTIFSAIVALVAGFVVGVFVGSHPKADGLLTVDLYNDPPLKLRLALDAYAIIKRKGLYIAVDASKMNGFKEPETSEESSK